jgi:hypothetical protein
VEILQYSPTALLLLYVPQHPCVHEKAKALSKYSKTVHHSQADEEDVDQHNEQHGDSLGARSTGGQRETQE